AGPAFTIVPTALAGALTGAIAALLAALALRAGLHVYGDALGQLLASSLGAVTPMIPDALHVLWFVALGGTLGLLGGGLAGASRVAR
ncbi:MAG: hypothetical protein M3619_20765, partial [Myxococcota bacterium]|nr:hypothetical protein [Myxococcota bacterium]